MMQKNLKIITLLLFLALLLPALVQQGMFLDGVTYAAIAKNMANGVGTIWEPHYTQTLYSSFYEHPPLALFLESLFFRVFGDHYWVERLYSLIAASFAFCGMIKIWSLFAKDEAEKQSYWFPILYCLFVPVISWSIKNNMLENTLMVFTTFSSYYLLKTLLGKGWKYILPATLMLIFALLTKGLVGLFPLAIPFIYFLLIERKAVIIRHGLFFVAEFAITLYLLMLVFPGMKSNFEFYLKAQVIPTLGNKRDVSEGSRFLILVKLFFEMLIPIILVVIMAIIGRRKNLLTFKNKPALLLLLIGVSASFPLIISQKQSNYYLLPAIPFFALGFSLLVLPVLKSWTSKSTQKANKVLTLVVVAGALAVVVLTILNFGKYERDQQLIEDIKEISQTVPKGEILSTNCEFANDWTLVAYMSRIGALSLDCKQAHKFILQPKSGTFDSEEMKKVKDLNNFLLLVRY